MKAMKFGIALLIVILAVALAIPVAAAPPPDGPPGLERAIQAQERHADAILGVPGVAGLGVGASEGGAPIIIVFTEKSGVRGLPSALNGVPVSTRVSGKFYARPKPDKPPGKPPKDEEPPSDPVDPTGRFDRPVPIGVSTGHPDITAGTIGARVKRVIDGTTYVYALSNNHVYADENNAPRGDHVIQPGTHDGGSLPIDYLGILTDFVPINFGGVNIVDAAVAISGPGTLSNSTPSDGYGTPKSTTATASVGMKVKKYGRTTGQTKGRVSAINAMINVQYDSGVALFIGQIMISPGSFSAGGDSGSLIVVDDKRGPDKLKPVGLLFAGNSLYTIANPIDPVLASFGVTIDGS